MMSFHGTMGFGGEQTVALQTGVLDTRWRIESLVDSVSSRIPRDRAGLLHWMDYVPRVRPELDGRNSLQSEQGGHYVVPVVAATVVSKRGFKWVTC